MTVQTVKKPLLAVLCFLLLPSVAAAQGIKVTSVYGPVEVIRASSSTLTTVDRTPVADLAPLEIGDEIRTGPDAQLTLELPDGSYIVVSENSHFKVEPYWGSDIRNLMRVFVGRVRFHIQKLGGRPNPYRVHTPTALIAVRGTDFDVRVETVSGTTEIYTFEGRVRVEAAGDSEREVVLDADFKTRVRAGQTPSRPVRLHEEFPPSRTLQVVRTDGEDAAGRPLAMGAIPGVRMPDADNDRRNRTIDPLSNAQRTGSASPIRRGKLSFP